MKKASLLLTLIFPLTLFSQEIKPRVGVLTFSANGISEAEANVIGELFTSELVDSQVFDIVDRNNIDSLLKEVEFQNTGCTDTSCAVEIGKILSLEYMIYGSVSQLGESLIINVQKINIATAQIEQTARQKMSDIEESYDIMHPLVEELTGIEYESSNRDNEINRPILLKDLAQEVNEEIHAEKNMDSKKLQPGQTDSSTEIVIETDDSDNNAYKRTGGFDFGGGYVFGTEESGVELEMSLRIMFGIHFGIGITGQVGYYYPDAVSAKLMENMVFGYGGFLYWGFTDFLGISIGYKGRPEYISSLAAPSLGLHLGDFYIRGACELPLDGIYDFKDESYSIVAGFKL